jgi:tripartite-type tricarboxylate transporter receptor subunit TctC
VVARLSDGLRQAIASPAVQKPLQAAGIEAESSTSAQMTARLGQDLAKWRAVIDKAGIPRQ